MSDDALKEAFDEDIAERPEALGAGDGELEPPSDPLDEFVVSLRLLGMARLELELSIEGTGGALARLSRSAEEEC